jgi:hypothetical protein
MKKNSLDTNKSKPNVNKINTKPENKSGNVQIEESKLNNDKSDNIDKSKNIDPRGDINQPLVQEEKKESNEPKTADVVESKEVTDIQEPPKSDTNDEQVNAVNESAKQEPVEPE